MLEIQMKKTHYAVIRHNVFFCYINLFDIIRHDFIVLYYWGNHFVTYDVLYMERKIEVD